MNTAKMIVEEFNKISVYSTDFLAIANSALDIASSEDSSDASLAKFKAANIIANSINSSKMALCIESLLWAKNKEDLHKRLTNCKEVYVSLYGRSFRPELITLSENTGPEWWNAA